MALIPDVDDAREFPDESADFLHVAVTEGAAELPGGIAPMWHDVYDVNPNVKLLKILSQVAFYSPTLGVSCSTADSHLKKAKENGINT